MTVEQLVQNLSLKVLSGSEGLTRQVTGGYTSDLLSDVMGKSGEGQVWITIQSHINVMAIAGLKDLAAVILASGVLPDEEMTARSQEEGIPVLSTSRNAFEMSGVLYEWLKKQ